MEVDSSHSRASPDDLPKPLTSLSPCAFPASSITPRKCTPARSVYHDFPTAHSSITSGSGKIKSRTLTQVDLLAGNGAIPMKTLKSNTYRSINDLSEGDLPTELSPAMLKNAVGLERDLSELDFDVHVADFSSTRPPKLDLNTNCQKLEKVPLFGNFRKARVATDSPALSSRKSPSSSNQHWPQDFVENPSPQQEDPEISKAHALAFELLDSESAYGSAKQLLFADRGETGRLSREKSGHEFPDVDDIVDKYYGYDTAIKRSSVSVRHDALYTRQPISREFTEPYLQDTTSIQEDSTVDKIVREYARNHRLYEVEYGCKIEDLKECDTSYYANGARTKNLKEIGGHGVDSSERQDLDFSRREVFKSNLAISRQINPSGNVPGIALPQIPSGSRLFTTPNDTEKLATSCSYGDTRNLLEITQRSKGLIQGASTTNNLPRLSPDRGRDNLAPPTPSRNPYHLYLSPSSAGADSSPQSAAAQNTERLQLINSRVEDIPVRPRVALERDVSRALRHVSMFSCDSQESFFHDQGNGGFQSSSGSSNLLNFTSVADAQSLRSQDVVAQRGFYNPTAIPQTWMGSPQLNCVRIPVNRTESPSSSLPESQSLSRSFGSDKEVVTDNGNYDDANDWETVGDSALLSRNFTNPYATLGGNVYRAGSSVADVSNDGTGSLIHFEHNDFSSTDRITQHPARIEYSHDYRQRNIKDVALPILLPAYKQHTVNGLFANSFRTAAPACNPIPNTFKYQTSAELTKNHANPFKSSPPEVMLITGSVRKPPKNVQNSDTSPSGFHDLINGQEISRPMDATSVTPNLSNWMNDFGEPGPAICPGYSAANGVKKGAYRDDAHQMHGYRLHGSRTAGSSIADESSSSRESLGHYQNSAVVNQFCHGMPVSKEADIAGSEVVRPPLVKRPPGTFYQDLRTGPEHRTYETSAERRMREQNIRHARDSAYPTNKMRPLSLLTARRLETAMAGDAKKSAIIQRSGEFVYRSPLAPIKSRSWRHLYTVPQLTSFREATKRTDIIIPTLDASQVAQGAANEQLKTQGSWKCLPGSPQMFAWARENSSVNSGLSERKRTLSILVLVACCLFPPLLILYWLSYMDNLMLWMTNGNISHFGKGQKRAARRLALIFFIAAIVGIAVTLLVEKFATSKVMILSP